MNDDLRHLFNLGRDHYRAGEYDKAEGFLSKIIQQHRGFADVFNMLGVICHSQERFDEAEEHFEQALRINENYTEAALNLSITCNDRGKYDKAREVYQRILDHAETQDQRLDPFAKGKLANMHAELGEAYAGLGLIDEAVEQLRRALDLCSHFVDLRTKLGNFLRDKGDLRGAIAEYERVKAEKPDYLPARVALGMAYYSLGNREDALTEWNDTLDRDPDNKIASMYLRMVASETEPPKAGTALDNDS